MNPVQTNGVPLANTPFATPLIQQYLNDADKLKEFIQFNPDLEGLTKAMKSRENFPVNRSTLVSVLQEQYKALDPHYFENVDNKAVSTNIKSLSKENTFSVTTGHQPLLFGGPLYFIYKIVSVINLARELNKKWPEKHVVPVLWLATEDHDFNEISQTNLFGNTIQWDFSHDQEPVGRLNPESILPLLKSLSEKFENTRNGRFLYELFENAYGTYDTFSKATRFWLNRIFRSEGLVILDPDNKELKKSIQPIAESDIFHQVNEPLVNASAKKLEKNFKAPVNPRKINFFYLKNGKRFRIIPTGDEFKLGDDKNALTLSKEKLTNDLSEHPENFSPNVVTRPMYQEAVLPNLAYIGGAAEIAYWMELKTAFKENNCFFPVLIPRSSVLWIGKGLGKKLNKLQVPVSKLLNDKDTLVNNFLENLENHQELDNETSALEGILENLKKLAPHQPDEVRKVILDYSVPGQKNLDKFRKSLRKAVKERNETELNQLLKVYDKLFPNGNLQERYDNLIPYYLSNGMNFFSVLLDNLNTLDGSAYVFCEE